MAYLSFFLFGWISILNGVQFKQTKILAMVYLFPLKNTAKEDLDGSIFIIGIRFIN